MLGVYLRGTRDSILAVAVLHSVFNRSNNDEGVIAALVEGDGRKLAGLLAVIVLGARLPYRRLARSAAAPPPTPSPPAQGTHEHRPTRLHQRARIASAVDEPHGAQPHEEVAAEGHRSPAMSVAVANPDGSCTPAPSGTPTSETAPASVDDQYPWFSMTKIATATTAMRLHRRRPGPRCPHRPLPPRLRPHRGTVTRRHANSSPTPRASATRSRCGGSDSSTNRRPAVLAGSSPSTDPVVPSVARGYSNVGYLLAGEVIAAATGHSVEDNVRDQVLEPLGWPPRVTATDRTPASRGVRPRPAPRVPLLRAALPAGSSGPGSMDTRTQPFLINGAPSAASSAPSSDAVKLAAAHATDRTHPHPPPARRHPAHGSIRHRVALRPRQGWFRKPADAHRLPAFVEHYGTGGGFWNAMRIYPDCSPCLVCHDQHHLRSGTPTRLFTRLKDPVMDRTNGFDVERARRDTPGSRNVAHLNNAGAALPPTPSPTP